MGLGNRVLVTGGDGQLGRALRRLLPEATVLGRRDLDVSDIASVGSAFEKHRPLLVINAAAYTKVDAAESDPDRAYAVNAVGPANLADYCRKTDARLVQVSTDYVFAGAKTGVYLEDDETRPMSVYGKSKLEGESAALANVDNLVVRTSWVFGDGFNFIKTIVSLAASRDHLTVVADQWGLPTYAEDLAPALVALAAHRSARGIFHVAGSGPAATWAEVAEVALGAVDAKTEVHRTSTAEYYSAKQGPIAPRPANSVLDCTKALSIGVGLRPWRQAVVRYVNDFLKENT